MTARVLGVTVHTGWAACVIVDGSLTRPEILARERIELLGASERFCFHRAAEMPFERAQAWIDGMRSKATANATRALAPLWAHGVTACAIVARNDPSASLEKALASHPQLHRAEADFYRDVLRNASVVPVHIVAPVALDVNAIGRLAAPPWGRDQKLAALAAWSIG
jgi:hypothetical protein